MCAASCIGADLISESDAELCHTDLNQPPHPHTPICVFAFPRARGSVVNPVNSERGFFFSCREGLGLKYLRRAGM